MNLFDFFLLTLATWRLSSLLVNEKGPFRLFERLRTLAGIESMSLDDKPEVYRAVPDSFMAQVLDCVWCCSVWIGTGWTLLHYFIPQVAVWLALPLALSAMAIGVQRLIGSEG